MQTMTNGHTTAAPAAAVAPVKTIKLKPTKLTPENWKPYGQIVGPSFDGKEFDSDDAQLDLSGGIPRYLSLPHSFSSHPQFQITAIQVAPSQFE
jgi:hypothetical protein